MKIEVFRHIVESLKKHSDTVNAAYALEIDLINFNDSISSAVHHLIGAYYGKEGQETFDWWCYEKDWGNRKDLTMTDANGVVLCESLEELHRYLEENRVDDYEIPRKLSSAERYELLKKMFS
jgi:hypothetical protein